MRHLLKKRYRGYKLILTGDPGNMQAILDFIREHNIENDVLCLNGLSPQQLAACYRLADLAVNPSLSGVGFPLPLPKRCRSEHRS
jgi:glycosyltransferase involved in cell wall biosynthesis